VVKEVLKKNPTTTKRYTRSETGSYFIRRKAGQHKGNGRAQTVHVYDVTSTGRELKVALGGGFLTSSDKEKPTAGKPGRRLVAEGGGYKRKQRS